MLFENFIITILCISDVDKSRRMSYMRLFDSLSKSRMYLVRLDLSTSDIHNIVVIKFSNSINFGRSKLEGSEISMLVYDSRNVS